jgi:hypothetical protein
MLLFLQHVEAINVYVRSAAGAITELANVSVRYQSGSSRADRQMTQRYVAAHSPALLAWLADSTDEAETDASGSVSGTGDIDAVRPDGPPAAASCTYSFDIVSRLYTCTGTEPAPPTSTPGLGPPRERSIVTSRWLVHATVEPSQRQLAVSLNAPFCWSSVAVSLNADGAGDIGTSARPLKGSCYCFLPLPIETGLPIHVHGSFVLTQNRRSLWAGGGQSGVGKEKSEWNRIIIEELLPRCYARALAQCTQHVNAEGAATLFDVWPCEASVQAPFAPLLTGLLEQIVAGGHKLFHEPVSGLWHSIGKVTLAHAGVA